MDDNRATALFKEYLRSGVVPQIIVVTHGEEHFYAVSHGYLLRERANENISA
jgi:hypothetical protein